jgi:hypothetical protein
MMLISVFRDKREISDGLMLDVAMGRLLMDGRIDDSKWDSISVSVPKEN